MTIAPVPLSRRLIAEFLGSAFLAAVVIESGIAARCLSPGQTGLELFEVAAATAAGLFAITVMFGPVSGGHFNPAVAFTDAAFGGRYWRDAAAYLPRVHIAVTKALYPHVTPAEAAGIIVSHHSGTTRAAHDGVPPSADRPPGPARPGHVDQLARGSLRCTWS